MKKIKYILFIIVCMLIAGCTKTDGKENADASGSTEDPVKEMQVEEEQSEPEKTIIVYHGKQRGNSFVFDKETGVLNFNGTGKMTIGTHIGDDGYVDYTNENSGWRKKIKPALVRKIIIGDKVTEIKSGAFACMKNLESVRIGDGVRKLGDNAFESCPSLKEVEIGKQLKV